jgi:hypothetical protein
MVASLNLALTHIYSTVYSHFYRPDPSSVEDDELTEELIDNLGQEDVSRSFFHRTSRPTGKIRLHGHGHVRQRT